MARIVPLRALAADDERRLIERCAAGERAAQRQLFEATRGRVHATLFRILGPSQNLDDVLQDTFLSVFRGLPSFRGESSLSTWIDRCAVRAALGHIRSRRRRPQLELVTDGVASEDPSAERRALAREATRRLYAVLDALPGKQRTAFALHAVDERAIAEVAQLMGASVVATKARVWRARRYLEKRAKADAILADYIRGADTAGAAEGEGAP